MIMQYWNDYDDDDDDDDDEEESVHFVEIHYSSRLFLILYTIKINLKTCSYQELATTLNGDLY